MRKNRIYILLIFIICSSCDLRTAEQYYDLAYDLEEKGEYKKAIEFLNKAIEKKPKFRAALLNRGADKSTLKDYKGAIKDYERIIAFDSNNTLVLMNIGNNYKRLNQYEKAIEYYTSALNTKGAIKSDSIYLELNIYNEWDKDSDYYMRKYEIQYERGVSYAKNNQHDLAIKDLENVIKYNYEKGSALVWLGESYLTLKDTLNAKRHLTESANIGMIDGKELLEKIK
jgi:tetratricopeptide (TPR) repeat protein